MSRKRNTLPVTTPYRHIASQKGDVAVKAHPDGILIEIVHDAVGILHSFEQLRSGNSVTYTTHLLKLRSKQFFQKTTVIGPHGIQPLRLNIGDLLFSANPGLAAHLTVSHRRKRHGSNERHYPNAFHKQTPLTEKKRPQSMDRDQGLHRDSRRFYPGTPISSYVTFPASRCCELCPGGFSSPGQFQRKLYLPGS